MSNKQTGLRMSAALQDVHRERERLRGGMHDTANLYQLAPVRIMAMMSTLGRVASSFEEPRAAMGAGENAAYADVTRVAAMAVAWLEAMHTRRDAMDPLRASESSHHPRHREES